MREQPDGYGAAAGVAGKRRDLALDLGIKVNATAFGKPQHHHAGGESSFPIGEPRGFQENRRAVMTNANGNRDVLLPGLKLRDDVAKGVRRGCARRRRR